LPSENETENPHEYERVVNLDDIKEEFPFVKDELLIDILNGVAHEDPRHRGVWRKHATFQLPRFDFFFPKWTFSFDIWFQSNRYARNLDL